tara:strand:+ start:1851 stop:2009 length:159 start_codon:yes stop_codon:yes gene_type:complete
MDDKEVIISYETSERLRVLAQLNIIGDSIMCSIPDTVRMALYSMWDDLEIEY